MKRRNLNGQQRREEAELELDSSSGGGASMTNMMSGRFEKGTREQLSSRRIVRSASKYKSATKRKSIQPPSGAGGVSMGANTNTSTTASNPFASISLATTPAKKIDFGMPSGSSSGGGGGGLASSSKTLSFNTSSAGGATKSFSFPSTTTTTTTTSSLSSTKSYNDKKIDLTEASKINLTFVRHSLMECHYNPLSSYDAWVKKYISKVQPKLLNSTTTTTASSSSLGATAISSMPKPSDASSLAGGNSKPFSSFSFGKPNNDASGAGTSTTSTTAPKPFTGFSFGGGGGGGASAPAPSATPAAAPPAPSTSTAPSTTEGSSSTSNTEEVEHQKNPDEDELLEIRAKYRKYIAADKEWKTYSSGVLRLFRHKTKGNCWLNIRDKIGKVQLNLAIAKGSTFTKTDTKTTSSVQFQSVQDQSVGMEIFALVTRTENGDELYAKLQEMAK